jgi:hypothetical protein
MEKYLNAHENTMNKNISENSLNGPLNIFTAMFPIPMSCIKIKSILLYTFDIYNIPIYSKTISKVVKYEIKKD